MDVVIDLLIVESDRPEHIAKHNVSVEEVFEIISGEYLAVEGKHNRIRLIGKTLKLRWLTVIIGERERVNRYGLVTARPTKKKEKILYQEFEKQKKEEKNGKN